MQATEELESVASSEEVKHLFTESSPAPGYFSIPIRSFATRDNTDMRVVGPVPITIDGTREYVSQVLITQKPQRVVAKLNYLIPQKLKQFQYSFNFQAWQDVPNLDNFTGLVTFEGLHFAEGQNLLAIRTTNYAGIKYNQLVKVILNSVPLQASRCVPESNYMTNNPYQPISVEFNKTTYYEDEAGKIQITAFDLDGTDHLSLASVTSEIDGAYHPYAKVNYTPSEPFQDGQHDLLVKAQSDVGVSQAIWSFFVDTQPPTISIEALQPYSPRAPNAQPLSIRYRTTDNLATFLRNITVRLYDPNGHLVTTIASYDTQSAGENYVMILPSSFEGLSDGNYSCAIKAFDEAGNGTSESVALTIDTTPHP